MRRHVDAGDGAAVAREESRAAFPEGGQDAPAGQDGRVQSRPGAAISRVEVER
jgi:hypothetical protein